MKRLILFLFVFGFGVAIFGFASRYGINQLIADEIEVPESARELAWQNTNFSNRRCHGYLSNETSYEWLYAHLDDEDQSTVDLKYLELLLEIDFDALNNEERLVAINNLKDELIDYIDESEFEIGSWR